MVKRGTKSWIFALTKSLSLGMSNLLNVFFLFNLQFVRPLTTLLCLQHLMLTTLMKIPLFHTLPTYISAPTPPPLSNNNPSQTITPPTSPSPPISNSPPPPPPRRSQRSTTTPLKWSDYTGLPSTFTHPKPSTQSSTSNPIVTSTPTPHNTSTPALTVTLYSLTNYISYSQFSPSYQAFLASTLLLTSAVISLSKIWAQSNTYWALR